MSDALQEVRSVLRNQAFEEIIENADHGASYMRSLGEAAYRGDARTARMHLEQLRLVVIAMIKTYKEYVDGDAAGSQGPSQRNREDHRVGDGDERS
jgi:hypothetical protein